MKRAKFCIAFAFFLASTVCVSAQFDSSKIFWKNVETKYKRFDEIQPVLVNESNRSIYLFKVHPYWKAHLKRFNDVTKEWESGGKGIGCGTVSNPMEPIEIKPNEQRQVELAWELSTDHFEKPRFFELQDRKTLRPLTGKYSLYLAYALEPWTLAKRPKQTFSVSAEFEISKKK